MLWLVFGVSIVAILIIVSLCKTASISDEQYDDMYQSICGGDNDGNNQDLQ